MKLNCCILEDEPAAARKLAELLEKWGKERGFKKMRLSSEIDPMTSVWSIEYY